VEEVATVVVLPTLLRSDHRRHNKAAVHNLFSFFNDDVAFYELALTFTRERNEVSAFLPHP
jgi:hypothetical protein